MPTFSGVDALAVAAIDAETPAEDAVESLLKERNGATRPSRACIAPRPLELARLPRLAVPERLGNPLDARRQLVAVGAERQAQLLGGQLL